MKQPINEIKRMQQLAGILKENQYDINEEVTAKSKNMRLVFPGDLGTIGINVDIENGIVTKVNDNIENSGITGYDEKSFATALKPFKDAGVKVEYKPWYAEYGHDYEGEYFIDATSLNNAITSKKITIKSDPEDPEDYLVVS